jgi:hypothetical protein
MRAPEETDAGGSRRERHIMWAIRVDDKDGRRVVVGPGAAGEPAARRVPGAAALSRRYLTVWKTKGNHRYTPDFGID